MAQPRSGADPGPAPDPASGSSRAADDADVAAAANGVYYPSPVPEEDQDDQEPTQGQRREAADGDDLLVGTFEVAFTEAARTKELTLNPPSVRRYVHRRASAVLAEQRQANGLFSISLRIGVQT